jgi:hypothetical protein
MSTSQCASVPPLVSESRPSTRGLSRVPAVLPKRTLRQVLNRALGTPSQLDAFLIDYFPDIFRQTSCGMDREAKLNLLLQEDSETHLTSLVHREFPQEVADTLVQEKLVSLQQGTGADPDQTLHVPEDEQRVKYTVVVTGTLDDMDRHIVEALLKHMRRYISDAELTIEAIRAGSVILTCTGTQYGLQKLFEDFEQGRLSELLEFRIIDIVQNLPSGQVPQLRVRKSLPPLQDSRITARFTWPTVAERIEEHKTVRMPPATLVQNIAVRATEREHPVPVRIITNNDSAGHCWQYEDTRRMQLPKPKPHRSFRFAARLSMAACVALVAVGVPLFLEHHVARSVLSIPKRPPDQNGKQDAVDMSPPTDLALPFPNPMGEQSPDPKLSPAVKVQDHPRLALSPRPNRLGQADSILQECVQLTFPREEPGDWLLTREQDGYAQVEGPLSKPSRQLPKYVLDAISRCLRWQSKASAIQLPPTLRIKVYRSVQDEGGLHIVVDTAGSGINSRYND